MEYPMGQGPPPFSCLLCHHGHQQGKQHDHDLSADGIKEKPGIKYFFYIDIVNIIINIHRQKRTEAYCIQLIQHMFISHLDLSQIPSQYQHDKHGKYCCHGSLKTTHCSSS